MSPLVRLSSWIYRALLPLYPWELRRDFGFDMTEAFAEDLACAWQTRSMSGVASVWWCAVSEVVTIAFPARLASPALRARAVSVALHIAVMGGIFAVGAISEAIPNEIWHGVLSTAIHTPVRR